MRNLYYILCLSLLPVAVWAEEVKGTPEDGAGGIVRMTLSDTQVALTCTPNTGYTFQQWLDGNTDNPRLIDISEVAAVGATGRTYQAVFVNTAATTRPEGSVSVTVPTANVPTFTLTANPATSENHFYCWSNVLSTDNPLTYTESMGHVYPRFSGLQVIHQDGIGGTITYVVNGTHGDNDYGFTLTPAPNSGFKFKQWEDNSTSAVRTVSSANATYTATFEEVLGAYEVNGVTYTTAETAIAAVETSQGQYPLVLTATTADNLTVATKMTIQGDGNGIGDLTILNGGDLTLSSALTVDNLYLNATRGSSSQLRSESNLTYNDAYIDITLTPGTSTANDKLWYGVAVPFNVDIETGIRRANAPDVACKSNTDYLLWEYDGQMRADNMENGWVKKLTGTLTPGHFYMMGINGNCNTWRFQIANGATLGGSASLPMSEFTSASVVDAGWNAMANSTLTYASAAVEGGITIAQFYANGATTARYDVINFSESGFVMASPFFVQVAADDQLTLSPLTGSDTLYAPSRRSAAPEYYKLQLMQDDAQADVVYLTASEDAENEYVIGKDVMKMMGGNTNSYLWTNAYGYRLCAQDARIIEGVAEYSLSMYAPAMATYSLALTAMVEEATLWKQEKQVWNFANGAYPVILNAGTTNGYVLRIGRGIGTNLISPAGENQGEPEKFIYRNTLFIRANGELYNAQGARMSNPK